MSVKAASGKDFTSTLTTINSTNLTYEVSQAPDDGKLYLKAAFDTPPFNQYYAYDTVNTSHNSTNILNFVFGDFKTIEATLTPPSGYTIIRLRSFIYNGTNTTVMLKTVLSTEAVAGVYRLEFLPPLKSGDSYCLELRAINGAKEVLYLDYPGCQAGPKTINLSSVAYPVDMIKFPPEGAAMAGSPTFEWNAVPGARYYSIAVNGSSGTVWTAITKDTKIKMPKIIADTLPTVSHTVEVYAAFTSNDVAINDLTTVNSWVNIGSLTSAGRNFTP